MKTVIYLKATLVRKSALTPAIDIDSFGDIEAFTEEKATGLVTRLFARVRERLAGLQLAQTMTDYALILAAIAIMGFGIYKSLRHSTIRVANGVDSTLKNP